MNERYATAVLVCVLAFATASSWAAPRAVKATYGGYMNGVPIGVISEHFESDGATYRIESDTKATGIAALVSPQPVRFSSAGQITREGLRPAQFQARRAEEETPRISADFDWSAGQLVLKREGKSESLPVAAGTQDRLSIMYQWMFMPLEGASELEFAMTNGRRLGHYRYSVTPDVEIDTALGRLNTLHVVRQRGTSESQTEVWLSVQHRHVPVKVLYVERDGVRFEQRIQSLEIRD